MFEQYKRCIKHLENHYGVGKKYIAFERFNDLNDCDQHLCAEAVGHYMRSLSGSKCGNVNIERYVGERLFDGFETEVENARELDRLRPDFLTWRYGKRIDTLRSAIAQFKATGQWHEGMGPLPGSDYSFWGHGDSEKLLPPEEHEGLSDLIQPFSVYVLRHTDGGPEIEEKFNAIFNPIVAQWNKDVKRLQPPKRSGGWV